MDEQSQNSEKSPMEREDLVDGDRDVDLGLDDSDSGNVVVKEEKSESFEDKSGGMISDNICAVE